MEYELHMLEWGLEEYSSRFRDEGITDESFRLLDQESINAMIPKLGPRLIFKRKLEELKNKQNFYPEVFSPAPSSIQSGDSMIVDIDDPQLLEIFNNTSESAEVQSEKENPLPAKIQKKSSLFTNGLEELLKTSLDGRIILTKKSKLNNDNRQKLAKIVINYLLSRVHGVTELKREEFLQAAEEIKNLFPEEEKETYYIPYSSKSKGLRLPARGKLWSRYVNVKAALRLTNTLTIKNSPEPVGEKNEEAEGEIVFLRTAIEPYARIIRSWDTTYGLRYKQYIMNKDVNDSLFDIFPCLRQRWGLELMEMDFNHMYPDKIDLIYSNWPKVANAIKLEAIERRIYINESNLDQDTNCLLTLPYLFSPVTLKKNSKDPKKNWRPTRKEIQNSFFFCVKDSKDLEDIITRRNAVLSTLNIPMQPFAYVLDKEYYVSIYDTNFKVESCVRCLETLFKAIHALNLEYAAEAKHIWHFIQEVVFQIPEQHKSSNTTAVITDIKHHLKKEE